MSHPVPTSQAREQLTTTVKRFRRDGAQAEPVVFGSHRKPEAVVLPYETYELLREIAEEVAIARTVAERDERDTGERHSLADIAEEFGVDLSAL